jgi:hypothetical protein
MGTSNNNSPDQLVTKKQAGSMLSMSLRSIDRLMAAGILDRVKVLGAVRVRLSQVLKIIEGRPS